MKRHALFVGVNAYDDKTIRQLKYSIPDASVLADRFKGFGYSTLLLADPTGAELKAAVMKSTEGLGSGDVFLFFFAGHGFTAQDGAHLLFCRDDIQRLLRVNAAGIRVDAIEALTSGGGFHRAFLLDSCRTDSFANVECRGGGTTRDLDLVAMPECTNESGSFYLLRSCDKFRPSLEFDAIGHGLFTQGLLDAMDARDCRLAHCDTSFATAIGGMMEGLQRVHHVTDLQRPSIGEVSGPVFSLFDEDFILPAMRVSQEPTISSPAYDVCPICGKHNLVTETFRCSACGRDHICLSHFSSEEKSCVECAQAALTKRQVAAQELFEKGEAHLYGWRGAKKDPVEAEKCYRKAAELGHVDAQFKLGEMYYWGRDISKSEDEAAKWYQKAAEQGHVDAQCSIGAMYTNGQGVPKSAVEATKWYRKAAEQGDAAAQYILAGMYCEGEGVSQSYEEAVKWYRKSAEQGDFDAQEKLGRMYEEGLGVPQSYEEAAKWYQKAVDDCYDDLPNDSVERSLHRVREKIVEWQMVDPEKLYAQGVALMKGDGCLKSDAEAFKCFKRAALVGHVKAIEELAECYYRGRGVDKNQDEAFEWFSRSNTENAKKALAEIIGAKKRCIRITSYRSFGLKKQEYLRLLNEEMPANVKRIEAARSRCADKSSDEEYLKAKDDQRALMMKQTLMQAELEDVYPSDFADATTDMVMPGVTVVVATKGGNRTLTVLGEWDNDEAMKIYSSMTQIAKNMMGKMVGDSFELPDEDGNLALATIKEIRSPSAEVREWMKLPAGVKI